MLRSGKYFDVDAAVWRLALTIRSWQLANAPKSLGASLRNAIGAQPLIDEACAHEMIDQSLQDIFDFQELQLVAGHPFFGLHAHGTSWRDEDVDVSAFVFASPIGAHCFNLECLIWE